MNSGWLQQLAPAHQPGALGWWPLAPGWWILAGLAAVLVAAGLAWLRRPRRTLRRAALRELERIRAGAASAPQVAQSVQNLLRRYALQVFGFEAVAALTGEYWLTFVIDQGGSAWRDGRGRSLLQAAYGHRDRDDRREWLLGAEQFIRRAGRKARRGARP